MNKPTWIHNEPLKGTHLFPHHRRWDCARAILGSLRAIEARDECEFAWYISRACVFNRIMHECNDPLAAAYSRRISKIRKLQDPFYED